MVSKKLRALILAAGYGTRLGEQTKSLPKALIEVGGIPIIDRTIHKLVEVGITEITINTHYLSEMVVVHLNKRFQNLNIRIVFEPKLLGTAGTLKANIEWLAIDDFIVMHGDNFFTDTLFALTMNDLKPGNLVRAGTFLTNDPMNCGVFTVSEDNSVIYFDEKKQHAKSNIANAAIYRFSKYALNLVSNLNLNEKDISLHVLPLVLNKIELAPLKGDFIDIGTESGLKLANILSNPLQAMRNRK
jgi:mannose-1-phosphate guanylyltransferase